MKTEICGLSRLAHISIDSQLIAKQNCRFSAWSNMTDDTHTIPLLVVSMERLRLTGTKSGLSFAGFLKVINSGTIYYMEDFNGPRSVSEFPQLSTTVTRNLFLLFLSLRNVSHQYIIQRIVKESEINYIQCRRTIQIMFSVCFSSACLFLISFLFCNKKPKIKTGWAGRLIKIKLKT